MINLEGVVSTHWQKAPAFELFPGVQVRILWSDGSGARACYLAFAAGSVFTTLDVHDGGPEEVFVLSGVYSDGVNDYPAGSFIHNPKGSAHLPQSKEGCAIFLFLPEG
ncbi:MAG: cupin domain-containing protein [Pseudomonadota bacterium]